MVWGLVWTSLVAAQPASKQIQTTALDGAPIELDGRLDEPVWDQAQIGTEFVERVPFPGTKAAVKTEFRVLVSEEALYVGVICFFPPGEEPRALELQRDSFGIFSDEALSLKFDVRHDTRTTVGFVTNPAGAQFDYVAIEGGDAFRREFDAIWDVATRVESDRWVAEFWLPAVALGLPKSSADRIVGLNVTRDHNARLATYDWSAIPAEFGPTSALFYGDLIGTESIGGGQPLSLIPYGLTAYDSRDDSFDARVGGDIRLRVAEDIWGELTVLTDFAQVDLDDPVVNLDRFALFFPERRPFFLSGVEFFEFGAGGEAQVYFSRRIGLDASGETIELISGIKAYGTVDDFRFGVLNAITAASETDPLTSFSILRVRQNFGENAHVGAISTLRTNLESYVDDDVAIEPELSFGLDGSARAFDRRLFVSAFGATSVEGIELLGFATETRVGWLGYHLQPQVSLLAVDDGFAPAVGFVRRSNRLEPRADLQWITRTDALGLQRITVFASTSVTQTLDTQRLASRSGVGGVSVLLRSGFALSFEAESSGERVFEETEIAGFTIEPGLYEGYELFVSASTPGGRNPAASLSFARNTAFFGGTADSVGASVDARFGPNFLASSIAELTWLNLQDQQRTTLTTQGRITWTPNTRFQVDLIGQANSFEEEGTVLGRIRWRYLPGSDLFFVVREAVDSSASSLTSERTISLKASYRLDALL